MADMKRDLKKWIKGLQNGDLKPHNFKNLNFETSEECIEYFKQILEEIKQSEERESD